MPELPEHHHRPRHSQFHSGGTDKELSLSLFHLPPSQMGVKPLQGDAGAVQRVEEGWKVIAHTWVRNNMC